MNNRLLEQGARNRRGHTSDPFRDQDWTIDARGTWCPVPIIEISKAMKLLPTGAVVLLVATDPAVETDLKHWCSSTGNELLSLDWKAGALRASVRKGSGGR